MKFEFNNVGVCTNPEVFRDEKGKGLEYQLRVAELPCGHWGFGARANWNVKGEIGGVAHPVSSRGEHFPERAAAEKAATEWIEREMSRLGVSPKKDTAQLALF